jgi:hypothetical protein
MGDWSQDGDVENNERKTLPERPQRSHWKFNYKYHIQVSKSGTTFLVIVCGSVSRTARTSVLPSFAAHIRPVIPS